MHENSHEVLFNNALVALAAFCWGISGGIGGFLIGTGHDPLIVSFYRGIVGLACVAIWLALRHRNTGLADPATWGWSALAGLGITGNFTFYSLSISEGSVAVAATLMYCAPIFVFLVSFALGIERPTLAKVVAIFLVLMGIVLLTRIHDIKPGGMTLPGVSFGLLAGLSYSLFIFSFKFGARRGSSQALLTIAFATLALLLAWSDGIVETAASLSRDGWVLFLTVGILGAGLSFIIYIRGLKRTSPAVASVVAMLEPVTASAFGVLVLAEQLEVLQWVGMALILVTVTALSFSGNVANEKEA